MPQVATRKLTGYQPTPWSPPRTWVAVSPSDTDQFTEEAFWLQVGTGGTVTVICNDGSTTAQFTVPTGGYLYGVFLGVKSAGTSASNILRGQQ